MAAPSLNLLNLRSGGACLMLEARHAHLPLPLPVPVPVPLPLPVPVPLPLPLPPTLLEARHAHRALALARTFGRWCGGGEGADAAAGRQREALASRGSGGAGG